MTIRALTSLVAALAVSGCAGEDGAEPASGTGTTFETETGSSETGDPEPDECIPSVSAGDHVFECMGLSFNVTVPDACVAPGCGLIVDVHGYSMSATMQDANTNLRELARQRAYVVVQPNATPAPPLADWVPAEDDAKVFDFMMRAASVYGIDDRRIHFTGFSQGGYMSWRFACNHADVLASVAPAAACGGDVVEDCDFSANRPANPISILYMHGTEDALVPFGCAGPRRDAVVGAFGLGAETVVAENDAHRWTRHQGDATVEFIEHDYAGVNAILGGHCYPGSVDAGTATGQLFSFRCEGEQAFNWGVTAIDFFDAHPKP